MRTLKRGLKGEDVRQLQAALNKAITAGLAEDGIFGAKTQAAVRNYQRQNKLTVDGIAGRQTLGALGLIDNSPFEIKCEDLKQYSAPHGSMIYGPNSSYSTYGKGGCGVTSFAVCYRAYGLAPVGETSTETIQRIGKYAWQHGYRPKGGGTNLALFGTNGLHYASIKASQVEDTIRAGFLVVFRIKKGFPNGYTGDGHYIVGYGIKDGNVLLRDVGFSAASRQKAPLSKIGTGLKGAYKIYTK